MADKDSLIATKEEVPGASLGGRDPATLTMPALKRWLQCRAAPTKGKKAELVGRYQLLYNCTELAYANNYISRVNAYIRNGWDEELLVNPDRVITAGMTPQLPTQAATNSTWSHIHCSEPHAPPAWAFTNAQIISYFVTRTADDGLPVADFKSLNNSAGNLYHCGHVQKIEVCYEATFIYLRAISLPEMRRDREYRMFLKLSLDFEIVGAQCGCPAGLGPKASCKHIAALCYALEEFTRLQQLPSFQTPTERLQTWNQPRPKKFKPIAVEDMRARKEELLPPKVRPLQQSRNASLFDPRPEDFKSKDPVALENLRCQLVQFDKPCALTHLLIPLFDKIDHDHSYCNKLETDNRPRVEKNEVEMVSRQRVRNIIDARVIPDQTIMKVKDGLNLSSSVRTELEMKTRDQSESKEWHNARIRRITSSTCGQILTQKHKTIALLHRSLYPKRLNPLPSPIAWGIQNEQLACVSYQKYMHSKGHCGLTTTRCGFIVLSSKGWLGASPDARVYDPSSSKCNGIAEFKCPYSKRDKSPLESCEDPNFFCELHDSGISHLKRTHNYYHQVQLQLYVGSDLYDWCDFCVYTPIGITVERIRPSEEWQLECLPKLEEYYDRYIAPEIVTPLYKPSYVL